MLYVLPALVIAISINYRVSGESFSIGPHPLREYQSYADVDLTAYQINGLQLDATWTFGLMRSHAHCPNKNATIHIQHGGYPVINPLGEQFPAQFYTNITYGSGSLPLYIIVQAYVVLPKPGTWYVGAYLNHESSNKHMALKGLGGEPCEYFLRSRMETKEGDESVITPVRLTALQTITIPPIGYQIFSFFLNENRYSYTVSITSCSLDPCGLELQSDGSGLYPRSHTAGIKCENGTSCDLFVIAPAKRWNYLLITNFNESAASTFTLTVTSLECGPSITQCAVENFDSTSLYGIGYTKDYITPEPRQVVSVSSREPYHGSIYIEPKVDIGGTLRYNLTAVKTIKGAQLFTCIEHERLSWTAEEIYSCSERLNLTLQMSAGNVGTLYIPYPRAGYWYLSSIAKCPDNQTDCPPLPLLINATVRPCVDFLCGKYGECRNYFSQTLHFSVCKCKAGYRGYGCTDNTNALSDNIQLMQTLFLTISNVPFLAAAALAIYRRWFSESLVYTFVFICSTLYHMCDNGTLYAECVAKYSLLQYCDFYGSVLAVWMTAMCLAEINKKLRSALHISGVLGILIGTQVTLTGLWNFAIPLIIAVIILATSWVRMCYIERSCFPKRRVWLLQLLPGVLLAIVGLVIYTLLETDDNYYYTHSIWHLMMAAAIMVLLPRDRSLKMVYCRSITRFFRRASIQPCNEDDSEETITLSNNTEADLCHT